MLKIPWFIKTIISPKILQIEPTTRCNGRCITCSRKQYSQQDLKEETLLQLLKRHPEIDVKLQGLGEPFMAPNLENLCRIIIEDGRSLSTVTNGVKVNQFVA
jgi:MoaA/NifB/PqqE/SkfB family radical SAM enzyme